MRCLFIARKIVYTLAELLPLGVSVARELDRTSIIDAILLHLTKIILEATHIIPFLYMHL